MLNKKDIKSCRSCWYHKPNSGVIFAKGACYCKLTDSHILNQEYIIVKNGYQKK